MIKLIAFDLDKTLADIGKGIKLGTIEKLKQLEEKGVRLAFCSGKTSFYLTGLLRQLELKQPIIVGENGIDIQFGIELPPKIFYFESFNTKIMKNLYWLKTKIQAMFKNQLYFQPNRIGVTPFPRSKQEFDIIRNFLNKNKNKLKGLEVYEHSDCFDIIPKNISKKKALEKLAEILNIKTCEMIAVGDGVNDYPMFEIAGLALGINVKEKEKVDKNFTSIEEALNYVMKEEVLNKKSC